MCVRRSHGVSTLTKKKAHHDLSLRLFLRPEKRREKSSSEMGIGRLRVQEEEEEDSWNTVRTSFHR